MRDIMSALATVGQFWGMGLFLPLRDKSFPFLQTILNLPLAIQRKIYTAVHARQIINLLIWSDQLNPGTKMTIYKPTGKASIDV